MVLEEHTLLSAYTAEQGFRLVTGEDPDIVLLDIDLPDQDGIQLLSKSFPKSRNTKGLGSKQEEAPSFYDIGIILDDMLSDFHDLREKLFQLFRPLDDKLL